MAKNILGPDGIIRSTRRRSLPISRTPEKTRQETSLSTPKQVEENSKVSYDELYILVSTLQERITLLEDRIKVLEKSPSRKRRYTKRQ